MGSNEGGAPVAPVATADRIDALDVLRGVAVCGILLMNIPYMGLSWHRARPPFPAVPDIDWIALTLQRLLFEGTMRGLFTLLFGAGMLLMLRRAETHGSVATIDVYVRRCIALLLLGIGQWLILIWPGEILFLYGMTGIFLLALRKSSVKALVTLAAAIIFLFSLSGIGEGVSTAQTLRDGNAAIAAGQAGKPLSDEQKDAIEAREELLADFDPTPAQLAEERERRTSFPAIIGWSAERWADYNIGGFFWLGFFESLAFMALGMALYRSGVLTGQRSTGWYLRLALIGYAIGLALRGAALAMSWRTGFQLDETAMIVRGIVYQPGRLAITLGHVGFVIWLLKAGWLGAARPLKALGRMALTNYMLASVITSILFYALGFYEAFGFAELMGIAALIWIATALFSMWWLSRHAMGPGERLLRAMAYGRRRETDAGPVTAPA